MSTPESNTATDAVRTGTSVAAIAQAFRDNLFYLLARFPEVASPRDNYLALAYTVRDRLLHRWVETARRYKNEQARTVCYFSAEFLLGPQLETNLVNLNLTEEFRAALLAHGQDLATLSDQEEEPGLGNGGLGRLAACYMDSLATLGIPAIGYGIRYEFGIFDQTIRDGCQNEIADRWLRYGNPWEIPRPEITFLVKLGGQTESYTDEQGRLRVRWLPARIVKGVAYDTPLLGFGGRNANLLRLFSSEAPEAFDFQAFNYGDYYGAVEDQIAAENLSKVLYPNDEPVAGKVLRLEQQYFFVSCALQDMLRLYAQTPRDLACFAEKFVAQLNDTHPAIAVAELMRLLVDERDLAWEAAWAICTKVFAYTNHTLLPEALEKWPLELFRGVLPRHLEIVYEINRRFLDSLRATGACDDSFLRRVSLIDEDGGRYVRMANLACVGSFAINGVAALHSELLKRDVLHDFNQIWPEKFTNVTNGVTPRRFLLLSNPTLSQLITDAIGDTWIGDLTQLRWLEPLTQDSSFCERWQSAKLAMKRRLSVFIGEQTGVAVDPASLFDIQVKRIHEYKRQHLNVLHVIALYLQLKQDAHCHAPPRTVIFGGKAAPGYFMAKLIIRLINGVAETLNADPLTRERLRVVFFPNFNVQNAQRIYPAAELSEQISLAGKEASGTGNMKFMMNGALTIGTLDGANVEIREEAGDENFFLFGLNTPEVARLRAEGYRPWQYYQENLRLREVLDAIADGTFSRGDRSLFQPLVENLRYRDDYMLLADFQTYLDAQQAVNHAYRDQDHWTRMSILNTARSGKFSSDRSIADYAREIWRVDPMKL